MNFAIPFNPQIGSGFTDTISTFGLAGVQGQIVIGVPFVPSITSAFLSENAIPGVLVSSNNTTSLDPNTSATQGNFNVFVPANNTAGINDDNAVGFLVYDNGATLGNVPVSIGGATFATAPFFYQRTPVSIAQLGSRINIVLQMTTNVPDQPTLPSQPLYWDTTNLWITATAVVDVTIPLPSKFVEAIPVGRGQSFIFDATSTYFYVSNATPTCIIQL